MILHCPHSPSFVVYDLTPADACEVTAAPTGILEEAVATATRMASLTGVATVLPPMATRVVGEAMVEEVALVVLGVTRCPS